MECRECGAPLPGESGECPRCGSRHYDVWEEVNRFIEHHFGPFAKPFQLVAALPLSIFSWLLYHLTPGGPEKRVSIGALVRVALIALVLWLIVEPWL